MVNIEFSFNENTYNSKIKLIEKIDLERVELKIDFLNLMMMKTIMNLKILKTMK